jgi:hypothetical protein
MTMQRILLTVGGLLLLSAGSLAAQETKVTCKDGTLSKGGQGACSSHGGIATKSATKVDEEVMKSAAKADAKAAKVDVKAVKPATKVDEKVLKSAAKVDEKVVREKDEEKDAKGATAVCKDKTYSHAKNRQGMCSGHGGVAKMMGK